jgi:hypothetical protein
MIMDIFNNCLTVAPMVDNLAALSPSLVAVRGESRKKQEMPIKARLIMDCVIKCSKFYGGRYLGSFGSRGSLATSLNPSNVHRPNFERIKRCPLTFKRVHTMKSQDNSVQNNSTQQTTTPAPDTYGIYRVDPDTKPPKGFKQVCNQCHFDKFSGAYRYCPNCGAEADSHCQYIDLAEKSTEQDQLTGNAFYMVADAIAKATDDHLSSFSTEYLTELVKNIGDYQDYLNNMERLTEASMVRIESILNSRVGGV